MRARIGPAAGPNALTDPELRLQHARDIAFKALNRRDRTEVELRRLLAGKRVEPAAIEQVIGELTQSGYVDDAGYAERFAADQRRLADWGPDRIARKLSSLGIAREHVDAALGNRTAVDEIDAAVDLLARRLPAPPRTPRDRDRALSMLVRKGFDLELAYDALRRFANAPLED